MAITNRHATPRGVHALPHVFNLLLGLWLIAAPFVLGFAATLSAPAASIAFGLAIALLAVLPLVRPEGWEEGVNLVLGFCLAASPWLFAYSQEHTMMLNAMVGGMLVIGFATWSLLLGMPGDHWWHHTHRGPR